MGVSALGGVREVLALPGFKRLYVARTASVFGDALLPVALAFAVLELTDSATALGLVFAAREGAQVTLVLLGGVIADRFPRYRVMVTSDTVAAVSQGLLAALLITDAAELWHVAALSAVNGCAVAFFLPASTALVPQLVPADRLQSANALLRLSLSAARIGGAGAAGVLVSVVGTGPAIAVDAATFAVSALTLVGLRLPGGPVTAVEPLLRQLRRGWDEFASRRWLWVVVAQFFFVNAVHAGTFNVLGPVIADHRLGGALAWSAILMGQGAGLVVGGLVALRVRPRRPLLAATLAVLPVVPLLGLLGLPTVLPVVVGAAFVAGIGLQFFGVLWESALQTHVPADALSRVASYDALGSFVAIPLGVLIAGPAAALVGAGPALMVGAVVVALATGTALSVGELRRLPATPAEPPAPTAVSAGHVDG